MPGSFGRESLEDRRPELALPSGALVWRRTMMEIEKLLCLIWLGRLGVFADLAIGLSLVVFGLLCLAFWAKYRIENE